MLCIHEPLLHANGDCTRYNFVTILKIDMKKIKIFSSKIHGKGMFADEDIKKDERIQYIRGPKTKKVVRSERDSNKIRHWIGAGKYTWINTRGTPFRYINHSCDPNAAISGVKTLIALKSIKSGEEITIDYSMTDADPYWSIVCRCGTIECRKEIRAIYTVPTSVFKKHMPYISRYFQRLYIRNYIRSKMHRRGGKESSTAQKS